MFVLLVLFVSRISAGSVSITKYYARLARTPSRFDLWASFLLGVAFTADTSISDIQKHGLTVTKVLDNGIGDQISRPVFQQHDVSICSAYVV